jgi:hypothetical protein
MMSQPDLEEDILKSADIRLRIKNNPQFAMDIYNALCNNGFVKKDDPTVLEQFFSWRYSAQMVAELTGGSMYDFYANGKEGTITPEVAHVFDEMGWVVYNESNETGNLRA